MFLNLEITGFCLILNGLKNKKRKKANAKMPDVETISAVR